MLPEHWSPVIFMLRQSEAKTWGPCPQVRSCVSFASYHPIKQHFSVVRCVLSVGRHSFKPPSLLGRPSLRHTFIHHFLWHTDTPPPHPLWLCVFGWADPVVLSMWTFEKINAYVCTLTTRSFHVLCKFRLEKKDKAHGNNLIEEKISLFGFVSF